ncbi:ecdysteroid-regulated 16 kDa protein-like [Anopheles ziemanni]|uniref:ecdysteroid-regulated 16 kDa protein-like n=1 Tax=Anopheles coustani TaxID=139045 RepID=UPI00265A8070|nr:ecdysteroid-regulated 16 kDa protein-like [Anopheles coustani]XP_058173716.1 ecdysteroid-regulated 16 kDa protein-like [Anopheles ziemanni]
MQWYQSMISLALLALCLHGISAEVVNHRSCPGEAKCAINEVSVTPCPEASEGVACTVYRNSNVSISFDFTPEFAANELTADASWTKPSLDLPLVGMDTEACKHTPCPTEAGKKQTYTYNLAIKKTYPPQHYDVKWKLTSENGDTCCLIVHINITKKRRS